MKLKNSDKENLIKINLENRNFHMLSAQTIIIKGLTILLFILTAIVFIYSITLGLLIKSIFVVILIMIGVFYFSRFYPGYIHNLNYAKKFNKQYIDLVKIYQALIKNLQLGMGYAIPCAYIPQHQDPKIESLENKEK